MRSEKDIPLNKAYLTWIEQLNDVIETHLISLWFMPVGGQTSLSAIFFDSFT